MHILVIGAAGHGRPQADRRAGEVGRLRAGDSARFTLADVITPSGLEGFSGKVDTVAADLSTVGAAETLVAGRPDAIFHLAAIVSGEAEKDFDKGYRNQHGRHALLLEPSARKASRTAPTCRASSSLVDRGVRWRLSRKPLAREFHTPRPDMARRKAICELLQTTIRARALSMASASAADHRGASGKPNAAASGSSPTSCANRVVGQEAVLR